MSSRFLKDLFPKSLTFENHSYVLLKDKSIYDTVTIATGDTRTEYFLSKSGKQFPQANFFGDESLVREKNVFMVLQLSFYPRVRLLDVDEWHSVYHRGFFEMKVVEPEKVTVDEDKLVNISPHIGASRTATASGIDEADSAGRNAIDRRTYLINENKFVPGGRSFQFVVTFPEAAASSPGAAAAAAGNGLLVSTDFVVELYGAEYERRG
jgi:hypothetical protein